MLLFSVVVVASFLCLGAGFPHGAPSIACKGMVPGHLPTVTSGTNPFRFNLSSNAYKPGETIQGTLYAPGQMFKGFLIEVGAENDVSSEETAVGEFINLDASIEKHVCGTAAVTHINNNEKSSVSFTWKASPDAKGTLYVRATVVQQFFPSRYWLGAFSVPLNPSK
ncbi:putative defense protein 3 [Dreissena polymorpha]|uniref:Reelin domain-containing protein n=1 Tax=Dreissena polymorpha TaxID=45954 RepID=A0A9D4H0S4_DREPO|nr:putative defense protein 3 [Dreissena polymorpha]KAH3826493.1 hypothetical protein DPMN_128399 [Dreissena polymorpha]